MRFILYHDAGRDEWSILEKCGRGSMLRYEYRASCAFRTTGVVLVALLNSGARRSR